MPFTVSPDPPAMEAQSWRTPEIQKAWLIFSRGSHDAASQTSQTSMKGFCLAEATPSGKADVFGILPGRLLWLSQSGGQLPPTLSPWFSSLSFPSPQHPTPGVSEPPSRYIHFK